MDVSVALLGPFLLTVGGREVPVPSRRVRAALAALALRTGQVVALDTLVDEVWDRELPARARSSLQTVVNRLRTFTGPGVVVTGYDGYLLDLPPDAVDVLRFQGLLDEAGDDPAAARERVRAALALWRGDPLTDAGSEPLAREYAPALRERQLAALHRRIALDLELGRPPADLVAELRQLTAQHPLREPLWALLMTALHRAGRPAEALDSYEAVRSRLAAELGADPSAELQEVHRRILADSPTGPIGSTGPIGAAGAAVPRQLPPDVPGFTGRGSELSTLDGLLAGPAGAPVPPCLVHGAGGVGKTTLAVHWARRAADGFPDGQLYLDLRGYGPDPALPPAAALDSLLRAVGVPAGRVPRTLDERSALLRGTLADRRMLLVLDNAHDEAQVRPLLPGGRNVVLVTSRRVLPGLVIRDGARRLELTGMTAGDSVALLAGILGAERTGADPAGTAALVEACGLLPLAVRIAGEQAHRHPDVPLAELAAALRDPAGLDLLSDTDDPFSNLRTVLDWSHESLGAADARVFRRLAAHPGGDVTLPEAAALAGLAVPPARASLDRLAAIHLVEPSRPRAWRPHDLLRAYAARRLAADEPPGAADAAVGRLVDWYLHVTYRARSLLTVGAPLPELAPTGQPPAPVPDLTDSAAAMRWYDETRRPLSASVRLALEHGHPQAAWRLGRLLHDFFAVRHHYEDWVEVGRSALRAAERVGDPVARYHACLLLGSGESHLADPAPAEPTIRDALRCAEELGDHAKTSTALSVLSIVIQRLGDTDRALELQERSVAAARRANRPFALAHSLLNLGARQIDAQRAAPAVAHTREALGLYRQLDARHHEAMALGNLAEAYEQLGDLPTALSHAEQALAVDAAHSGRPSTANNMITLGRIRAALGQRDAARTAWQQALATMRPESDQRIPEVEALLATSAG